MKYLKDFRLYEAVNDVFIEDILLDLRDEGFETSIKWNAARNRVYIEISNDKSFTYSEIEPSINRLSSYMKTERFFTNNRSTDYTHAGGKPYIMNEFNISYIFSSFRRN